MKSGTFIQKSVKGFCGGLLRWLVLLFAMLAFTANTQAAINYPFPQNYKYPYGSIYTGSDVQSTIQSLYTNWLSKYYVEGTINGTACARIKFVQASETGTNTVSEGIAYGMLIFVYMDNATNNTQAKFDKLWKYYQLNSDGQVMNWKVNAFTGTVASGTGNSHGATDADVDVATALLMADKQWGSTGTVDYLSAAKSLITTIWNYEVDQTTSHLKPGNAFNDYANPCYFINNALRLFATVDATHAWATIATGNLSLMSTLSAKNTSGLIPDWCYHDGTLLSGITSDKFESYFLYDAIRIPWRLAHDYAWYGTATSKTLSDKITTWAISKSGGDPSQFYDGYLLNGNVFNNPDGNSAFASLGKSQNPCFSAGLSIGAMTNTSNAAFMKSCWTIGSKNDAYGYYYTHTIQLLDMLFLTGNMPNLTDMRPVPVAAETDANGQIIYVDFSKVLGSTTSTTGWTVQSSADAAFTTPTTIAVSSISVSGVRVSVGLASSIVQPYIRISYNGTSIIASSDSKAAEAFTNYAVTNKITNMEPYPITRLTDILGTKVLIKWSKEILASSIVQGSFTVKVNGVAATVGTIAVNSSDATMIDIPITNATTGLAAITSASDVVTVTFAGGSLTGTTSTKTALAFTDAAVQNMYLSVTCYTMTNFDAINNVTVTCSAVSSAWSSTASDPVAGSTNKVGYYKGDGTTQWLAAKGIYSTANQPTFMSALGQTGARFKARVYVKSGTFATGEGLDIIFCESALAESGGYYDANQAELKIYPSTTNAWEDIDVQISGVVKTTYDEIMIRTTNASTKTSAQFYLDDIQICPPAPTVSIAGGGSTYDGKQLELRFNSAMNVPTDLSQISVKVGGITQTVTAISAKQGDATFLVVTLQNAITDPSLTITVSGGGTTALTSQDGRSCDVFSSYTIANLVGISVTTGWRDDFATTTDYVTANIGVGTSYTAAVESAVSPGTYKVTIDGSSDWSTLDITTWVDQALATKQVMNLTGREKVQFRYRVPSATSTTLKYRVSMKDKVNGTASDGMTFQTLTISSSWQDVTLDMSKLLFKQYDASGNTISPALSVDRTNIYQVMFCFISAEGTSANNYVPTQFKGQIEFDYISIGSPLLVSVDNDTINENGTINATSSATGKIYLVPNNTPPVLSALQDSVFAGSGIVVECTASVAAALATTGLPANYYNLYAYDPTAGAISSKIGILILDVTAPIITKFDSGNMPQGATTVVTVNEDAVVYMVPAGTAQDADAIITSAMITQTVAKNTATNLVIPAGTTLGASYIFYAIDYSNNISAATSPAIVITDNVAPEFLTATSDTIVKETDNIIAKISEAGTVYLVTAANVANITNAASLVTYATASKAATANVNVTFSANSYAAGSYVLYAVDASGNVAGPTATIVSIQSCVTLNSVSISPTSISILDQGTATASITIDPVSAPSTAITSITWTKGTSVPFTIAPSTDKKSCVVTGASANSTSTTGDLTVTIVGCSNTVTKTITVTVTPLCPSAISLDATSKNLYVKGTYDFTETVTGTLGTATVNWSSSDATVASVAAGGVVTANKIGTATITASLSCDATVKATATINVVKTPVTSISFVANQSDSVEIGTPLNLLATVLPTDATNKLITWTVVAGTGHGSGTSLNDTTVQVSGTAVGTILVTGTSADNSSATITKTIRVVPVRVKTITVAPTTVTLTITSTTPTPSTSITATVAPTTATDKTLTWTVSPSGVVSVAAGVVTAVADGTATITVTSVQDPSVKVTIPVTVTKAVPTAVTFTTTSGSVVVNNSIDITSFLSVTPATAVDKSVTWSTLDPTYASVTSGVVKGLAVGTARIVATSVAVPTLSATFTLTITPELVTSVTVTPATLTILRHEKSTLSASVLPTIATTKTVTWSTSDATKVTVDQSGNIYGVAVGSATITATANDASGKTGTCVVTVNPILPSSIVSSDISMLTTDAGKQITYTVLPDTADNKAVTFAVTGTTGVASVDANGLVTPTAKGTTKITITSVANSSITTVINVTVNDAIVDVTGVTLDQSTLNLAPNKTATLTATYAPSDANVSSIVWSSDNTNAATVDQSGVVAGVATGSAVITVTVTSPNATVTATCTVTVANKLVTAITPSPAKLDLLTTSAATTLTSTVTPTDATNANVTYAVTGVTGVVSVTSNGIVTVDGVGSTTITVTAADGSGITATIPVTVSYVAATSVVLSSTADITLHVGESSTLTATVAPTGSDQAVTWSVSATPAGAVAVVNGKITAIALGSAVVTCAQTANSAISATVNVNVVKVPVTAVLADKTSVTVDDAGTTALVTASVEPTNATVQTVTWKSLDETIAKVTNGSISGVAAGSTKVVVVSDDNTTIADTIDVTVDHISTVIDVTSITFDQTAITLEKGATATITATIAPANATVKSITWATSDGTIVAVSTPSTSISPATITLTAQSTISSATITATSNNGKVATATVNVIAIAVQSIAFTQTSVTCAAGSSVDLSQYISINPTNADNQTITYSVDAASGSISGSTFTPSITSGSAIVTATSANGKTATITVVVSTTVKPVTSITLDKTALTFTLTQATGVVTQSLVATVLPDDASDKSVVWSSSSANVSVVNGDVSINSANITSTFTATITATASNGMQATCAVTVNFRYEVTGVTITQLPVTINQNAALAIAGTVTPAAAGRSIVWSLGTANTSSGATIDQSTGALTAGGNGVIPVVATVTDSDGDVFTDTVLITVSSVIELISIEATLNNLKDVTMTKGETGQIQVVFNPTNTDQKDLTFESSSSSVTVSSTGLVTAASGGTATIRVIPVAKSSAVQSITVTVTEPITDIALSLVQSAIDINTSTTLNVTYTPSTASNKVLTVTSSPTGLVTITKVVDGQYTILAGSATGLVTLSVATTDGSAITKTISLNITKVITVDKITITNPITSLEVGKTSANIVATVTPTNANVKTLTWSANNATVTVVNDTIVTITGTTVGTATITATAVGGATTSFQVTILPVQLTGVAFKQSSYTITSKETKSLTAELVFTPANAADQTVTWAAIPVTGTGTIANGLFTPTSTSGTVTVTATNAATGLSASTSIVITPVMDSLVIITQPVAINQLAQLQLTASCYPTTITKTITWEIASSTSTGATISTSGLLTAGSTNGAITVKASATADNGTVYSDYVTVTVKTVIELIDITATVENATSVTMIAGSTKQIDVVYNPTNTDQTGVGYTVATVSGAGTIVTVSSTGVISAVGAGTATISVIPSAKPSAVKTITVTVTQPVTNIALTATKQSFYEGETTVINAVVTPYTATNQALQITAPANVSVNKISETQWEITGVTYNSNTVITVAATDGSNVSSSITLNVLDRINVSAVTIGNATATIDLGSTTKLSATVNPSNATYPQVTWSSNNPAIVVDQNGYITAAQIGTAEITATADGVSATVTIQVVQPVTSVTINPTSYTFTRNQFSLDQTTSLAVTIEPSYAFDQTVTWSLESPNSYVSVDANGTVTVTGNVSTSAVVVATSRNGKTGKCAINVNFSYVVTAIEITSVAGEISQGVNVPLAATIYPAEAASGKEIIWDIVSGSATVSSTGVLKATGDGQVVVSAMVIDANNNNKVFADSITYTVKTSIPVTGLTATVNGAITVDLNVGETANIDLAFTPTNTDQTAVVYSSITPSIAKVANGVITAVKGGTTTIYVTSSVNSSLKQQIIVNVIEKVSSITLSWTDQNATTIKVGETATFTLSVLESSASNKDVEYVLGGDTASVKLNNTKFTALKPGIVTVVAKATDGSGKSSNVLTLTIVKEDVTGVSLGASTLSIEVGDQHTLTATVSPTDATYQSLTWSTSNSSLATVSGTGVVTAYEVGTVTITVISNDNPNISASITVYITEKTLDLTTLGTTYDTAYEVWYNDRNRTDIDAAIISNLVTQMTNAYSILYSERTDTLSQVEVDEATRLLQEAIDNMRCNCWNAAEEIAVSQLSVFPIPATDVLNIAGVKVVSVEIFDLLGKKVAASTSDQVSLANVDNGVYKVVVTTDSTIEVTTITVLK